MEKLIFNPYKPKYLYANDTGDKRNLLMKNILEWKNNQIRWQNTSILISNNETTMIKQKKEHNFNEIYERTMHVNWNKIAFREK